MRSTGEVNGSDYGCDEFIITLYQLRDDVGGMRVEHISTGKFRLAKGHNGKSLMEELKVELRAEGIPPLPPEMKIGVKKTGKPRWSEAVKTDE